MLASSKHDELPSASAPELRPGGTMAVSARNQLKGKITDIVLGTVMAHVTIKVGENVIESVITRRSADEMKLKKGDKVTAVIKATEVLVAKP
jgi:molybdopterin-binding protein